MPVKNTKSLSPLQIDKLIQKGVHNFSAPPGEDKIRELHFELTFRCSSHCIMCDIWKKGKGSSELGTSELSLQEIERFVKESKLLNGVKKVILSGGEPFLRDDLPEICGFFTQHYPDASIGILTSLNNPEKVLTQTSKIFKKYDPKNLWFGSSLDGIDATHDKIRGRKGAFTGLLKTIKELRFNFPEVPVSLTFTLTPRNYRELLPAYELAQELNCWFGAQFVVQKENTEKFRWTEKHYETIEEQVSKIVDKLIKKDSLPEVIFWRYLVKYARRPQRYLKYCFMGKRIALIDPRGEVYVCPVYKEMKFGNIRERNFDELWLSEQAKKICEFIAQGKCSCWLYCSVMPVLEEIIRKVESS